jgi:hypothetical protein
MKNAPTGKTNKSALNALTSLLIVLANNPLVQQTAGLLALVLLTIRGVVL